MKPIRSGLVLSLLLVLGSVSVASHAAERAATPLELAGPSFFLVFEQHLAASADPVEIVFEFRDGERVIAKDSVWLGSLNGPEQLVRLPLESLALWSRSALRDPILRVLSGDRVLETFDPQGLATYNQVLRYSRAALFAEAIDLLGVALPAEPDGILCESPCGGGCGAGSDYDCDGIPLSQDNCPDHYNPNQANCDGDLWGDVCDAQDAVYQYTGPTDTCMTWKLSSPQTDPSWRHIVERYQVDVSSCNSPGRWRSWARASGFCSTAQNLTDFACCRQAIGNSILAVGDSDILWCSANQRNVDFCR